MIVVGAIRSSAAVIAASSVGKPPESGQVGVEASPACLNLT